MKTKTKHVIPIMIAALITMIFTGVQSYAEEPTLPMNSETDTVNDVQSDEACLLNKPVVFSPEGNDSQSVPILSDEVPNADEVAKSIYLELKAIGYSDEFVAAILGHAEHESALRTWARYGLKVSSTDLSELDSPKKSGAHGCMQWTKGRWKKLQQWAVDSGEEDWYNEVVQARFLATELKEPYYADHLSPDKVAGKSVKQLVSIIAEWYEGAPGVAITDKTRQANNWLEVLHTDEWKAYAFH